VRYTEWIRGRRHAIALVAVVLLGLSLRLCEIGAKSLWFDETFSVWLSRQSVAGIFDVLIQQDDTNPPLYALLLKYWLYLGSSEAVVRLLSALCSTVNIPVMYLLGRRVANRQLGLLAALILAVAPFHVRFAQEARMYALLSLAVTLSLYFLARLLSDPQAASFPMGHGLVTWWRSVRAGPAGAQTALGADPAQQAKPRPGAALATDLSWLGFIVFTDAALFTHSTAVLLPLSANLYVIGGYLIHLVRARQPKSTVALQSESVQSAPGPQSRLFLYNWLAAQLGCLLLLGPYIPIYIKQCTRVAGSFWVAPPTLQTVYDTWWELTSTCAPHTMPYNLVIPILFPVLAVLGLLYFRRQPRWLLFLGLFAVSPFALELLISLRRPIFLSRTLIWASIPYYLLLAAGLLQLRWRALALSGLAMLLVINGFSLRAYYEDFPKEQWREATAYVCERAGDEDFIILSAHYARTALDYYLPFCPKPLEYRAMNATKGRLEDLPELITGRPRIWLVYGHEWSGDPQELIAKALGERLRLVHEEHFYCVRVLEYVP
jgi:hypothetical protein